MKRGDWMVLTCCLLLAGALALPKLWPAGHPEVFVNGNQITGSVTVNGVAIDAQSGRARVKSSPCRDKLCVRAGEISRPGQVIVCLPQKVVIEIRGSGGSGVDAQAY
ncbi:MAG: NusG domain II-containing protein [Oscillospiraceae bacterium]|jgi:hypothetical protein|nr:NusG domain II-containing protein [Oscillospiraceae bacterium]